MQNREIVFLNTSEFEGNTAPRRFPCSRLSFSMARKVKPAVAGLTLRAIEMHQKFHQCLAPVIELCRFGHCLCSLSKKKALCSMWRCAIPWSASEASRTASSRMKQRSAGAQVKEVVLQKQDGQSVTFTAA